MNPIFGYDGYFADAEGNIWSMRPFKRSKTPPLEARKLKKSLHPESGYMMVSMRKNGKDTTVKVARAVLLAFAGPCPSGMEACHGALGKTCDTPDNLRWDTHEANVKDMKTFGEQLRGEELAKAKLTEEEVKLIRTRYASLGQMARDFNVARATISDAIQRRTWKHVA